MKSLDNEGEILSAHKSIIRTIFYLELNSSCCFHPEIDKAYSVVIESINNTWSHLNSSQLTPAVDVVPELK